MRARRVSSNCSSGCRVSPSTTMGLRPESSTWARGGRRRRSARAARCCSFSASVSGRSGNGGLLLLRLLRLLRGGGPLAFTPGDACVVGRPECLHAPLEGEGEARPQRGVAAGLVQVPALAAARTSTPCRAMPASTSRDEGRLRLRPWLDGGEPLRAPCSASARSTCSIWLSIMVMTEVWPSPVFGPCSRKRLGKPGDRGPEMRPGAALPVSASVRAAAPATCAARWAFR